MCDFLGFLLDLVPHGFLELLHLLHDFRVLDGEYLAGKDTGVA
jgi:hypothetical protein